MATRTRKPPQQLSPAARKVAERKAIGKASRQMAKDMRKTGVLPVAPTTKQSGGKKAAEQPAVLTPAQLKLRESTLTRNRQAIWPWLIVAALGGLGEGLYYAARYGARHITLITALVVTILGALLAARVHTKAPKGLRVWGDLCLIAGGWFLWWTAGRGVDWWVVLVGMLGTAGLGLRWWGVHRHPYPTNAVIPPPLPSGETIPAAWNNFVAHPKGMLPGIQLADHKVTKHTLQWTVALPREGTTTVSTVRGQLERLQHALNVPMEDLIWEQHPHLQYAGVLQVVTASPIKKPVFFDKPRMKNGAVLLGPYADGVGDAMWQVYTENSMWGGFLVGCTGSGKSRVVEEIALTLHSRRDTVIWFCDGQNGASSGPIKRAADWFTRADGFDDMLDALEGIASYRQDKMNYEERDSGFTPSPEFPGLLVILDECHKLLKEPGREKRTGKVGSRSRAERLDDLAAETRKLGISFLLATQHSNLDSFGGLDKLRSSVQARNTVVLRMSTRIGQGLIPNFDLDATKLPRSMSGFGYTVGSEDEAEGARARTAPFRARWLLSASELAKHPECPYPSLEQWFEQFPQTTLDAASGTNAGPAYVNRRANAVQQREELRRRIEGGAVATQAQAEAPAQAAPAGDLFGDLAEQINALPDFKMDTAELILPAGLSGAQQKVYMAIAKGHTAPTAIQAFLKLSPTYVNAQLKGLVDMDLIVHNGANGAAVKYELAERYGQDGDE